MSNSRILRALLCFGFGLTVTLRAEPNDDGPAGPAATTNSAPQVLVKKSSIAVASNEASNAPVEKVSIDVAAIDRERILRLAAVAMKLEPITITAFHATLSEGGTNDFYSNGDYWWPNPDTTNGLPYVKRDGETNPN